MTVAVTRTNRLIESTALDFVAREWMLSNRQGLLYPQHVDCGAQLGFGGKRAFMQIHHRVFQRRIGRKFGFGYECVGFG
jgi:hypothetical protein